jgi:predicted RNA-binding Zn-ribbon protein involved in translation (DUF1610 family)
MNCPECEVQILNDVNINECPNCGANIGKSSSTKASPEVYNCESCGEELEYITTYKQWYCYDCQSYVDHPAPTDNGESKIDLDPGNIDESTSDPVQVHGQDLGEAQEPYEHEETSWAKTEKESIISDTEPNDDFEWVDDEEDEEDEEDEKDEDHEDEEVDEDEDSHYEDEDVEDDDETIDFEINDDVELGESVDEELRKEVEEFEPEPKIELGESSIEEVSENDVEVEFFEDGADFEIEETDETVSTEPDLLQKALAKAHSAWVKVNELKNLYPDDKHILKLEFELKEILKGDADPADTLIVAEESIEELTAIEKELLNNAHDEVSNIFHIINSKILLAKKIGFEVTNLEDRLDNVTSLIAMGQYKEAHKGLMTCSKNIRDLLEDQSEILIGLEEGSELIDELLEQLPDT